MGLMNNSNTHIYNNEPIKIKRNQKVHHIQQPPSLFHSVLDFEATQPYLDRIVIKKTLKELKSHTHRIRDAAVGGMNSLMRIFSIFLNCYIYITRHEREEDIEFTVKMLIKKRRKYLISSSQKKKKHLILPSFQFSYGYGFFIPNVKI